MASGDPTPNSVIIWTRVTPEARSTPGSLQGPKQVSVTYQIATDRSFSDARTGTLVTSPQRDYTVKVDVTGLTPATTYYYKFAYGGVESPAGTTKTAPAPNDDVTNFNIAVASCANYESGYFTAYRDMAQRLTRGVVHDDRDNGIDLVVFLGDYIYEYGTGEFAGKSGVSRPHDPRHEIVSLEDYRRRYGRYRTDKHLQDAHAAGPWVVVWDDHEVANNNWRGGAENHTEGAEGRFKTRESFAHQAYKEWLPIRDVPMSRGGHIYRSLRFGTLIQLTMMDLRSYRDEQVIIPRRDVVQSPERTMLGSEQFAWLSNQLRSNRDTAWNVLGNSVMMSRLEIARIPSSHPDSKLANDVMDEFLDAHGLVLNADQWDGYQYDRARLFDLLSTTTPNTLVLTGDIHSEWANSLAHHRGGRDVEIGCEMVCTSISAPNVDEIVTKFTGVYAPEDNAITQLIEGAVKSVNPWTNHFDYDAHGYGIARVFKDRVKMDFYRASNIEDPRARVYHAVSRTWKAGQGFIDASTNKG